MVRPDRSAQAFAGTESVGIADSRGVAVARTTARTTAQPIRRMAHSRPGALWLQGKGDVMLADHLLPFRIILYDRVLTPGATDRRAHTGGAHRASGPGGRTNHRHPDRIVHRFLWTRRA